MSLILQTRKKTKEKNLNKTDMQIVVVGIAWNLIEGKENTEYETIYQIYYKKATESSKQIEANKKHHIEQNATNTVE